jgi:hypothetical protein
LRILDISDIANGNLEEVGFFDIYPNSDSANFNGAWSVYPFFASGNVVVSGIEQGLFVLRLNPGNQGDPPQVNIIEPVDNDPTALAGVVTIRIDATDTEDDADNLTVEWKVDDGGWNAAVWDGTHYTGDWSTLSVTDGPHTVTARAIDSSLSEGSDISNVIVGNGSPEFTVDDVSVNVVPGRGNRNTGEATVSVIDEYGSPVAGVDVDGSFSGGWSGSRSGTTDNGGQVLLSTPRVKNLSFVEFCVDNASKAGWTWYTSETFSCGGSSAVGSVAGSVISLTSGVDIPNAALSIDTGQSTNSDAFGDYSIGNVPVGSRTVTVTASGFDSQTEPASVTENNSTTVDFQLSETPTGGSGSIKGTVYSSVGGKLSGVTLQVLGGTSSLTNKGGKYTIQNVPAGLRSLTASKDGYEDDTLPVRVFAGVSVMLNFTLTPIP